MCRTGMRHRSAQRLRFDSRTETGMFVEWLTTTPLDPPEIPTGRDELSSLALMALVKAL